MKRYLLLLFLACFTHLLYAQTGRSIQINPLSEKSYRFNVTKGDFITSEAHFKLGKSSSYKVLRRVLGTMPISSIPKSPSLNESKILSKFPYGLTVTALPIFIAQKKHSKAFLQLSFFDKKGELIKTKIKELKVSKREQIITISEQVPTDGDLEITLGNVGSVTIFGDNTHFRFERKNNSNQVVNSNQMEVASQGACYFPSCECWKGCDGQNIDLGDGAVVVGESPNGDGHSDWVDDGLNNGGGSNGNGSGGGGGGGGGAGGSNNAQPIDHGDADPEMQKPAPIAKGKHCDVYKQMWEMQTSTNVEIGAWMTDKGMIILPTCGTNQTTKAYECNAINEARFNYYPTRGHDIGGGNYVWQVKYNNEWLTIRGAIHTHPHSSAYSSQPSQKDYDFAKFYKVPLYGVTRDGLWAANPDGTKKDLTPVNPAVNCWGSTDPYNN